METQERHQIVVGTDGSENASRALHWAIDEAKLRGADLRIVTVWHLPLAAYARPGGTAPPASTALENEVRQAAEGIAASAAKEVRKQADLPVETEVLEGDAAEVLIDVARNADLLVIGTRQRSHSGLLIGSVSVQCALHSAAPTTIVH